jgi:hypothetical protein
METTERTLPQRRALLATYSKNFGETDARTVAARRALIDAKIAVHEAAITELRRSLAELPEAS